MNTARIELLRQYLEEQPDDPFNGYALAMEYMKGQPQKALEYLAILLEKHPDYLPTYYHAAALYAAMEQTDKASLLYEQGMELARIQKNQKTHDELQRAYRNMLDEQE